MPQGHAHACPELLFSPTFTLIYWRDNFEPVTAYKIVVASNHFPKSRAGALEPFLPPFPSVFESRSCTPLHESHELSVHSYIVENLTLILSNLLVFINLISDAIYSLFFFLEDPQLQTVQTEDG